MGKCRPEDKGAKEKRKMLRRLLVGEEGKVPDEAAKDWQVEGKRVDVAREEYKNFNKEFEVVGQMAKKYGTWPSGGK